MERVLLTVTVTDAGAGDFAYDESVDGTLWQWVQNFRDPVVKSGDRVVNLELEAGRLGNRLEPCWYCLQLAPGSAAVPDARGEAYLRYLGLGSGRRVVRVPYLRLYFWSTADYGPRFGAGVPSRRDSHGSTDPPVFGDLEAVDAVPEDAGDTLVDRSDLERRMTAGGGKLYRLQVLLPPGERDAWLNKFCREFNDRVRSGGDPVPSLLPRAAGKAAVAVLKSAASPVSHLFWCANADFWLRGVDARGVYGAPNNAETAWTADTGESLLTVGVEVGPGVSHLTTGRHDEDYASGGDSMAVAVVVNSEVGDHNRTPAVTGLNPYTVQTGRGGVSAGYLRYRFRLGGDLPFPVRFVKRGSWLKSCLYVRNTALPALPPDQ